MKVIYYNAFLCKNGVKTYFPLHELFDFIADGTPIQRTQKVIKKKNLFLYKKRFSEVKRDKNKSVSGYEYINTNRTMWIGKFNDDKPFTGKIGSEQLIQITDELYQPNTCLGISDNFLFLMEYNFLGPSKAQIEDFLSKYIKSDNKDIKYDVRLFEIPSDKMMDLIPNSESIKSIKLTLNNESFHLSNMFPSLTDDKKTLFEKLFSSPVEVSNELDVNQTTIVLKKGRRKKEMKIDQISDILKLIRFDSDSIASAQVEFQHPKTKETKKIDLKHDGYYTGKIDAKKFSGFDILADLLTTHYYDISKRNKDEHYKVYELDNFDRKDFSFEYPQELSQGASIE